MHARGGSWGRFSRVLDSPGLALDSDASFESVDCLTRAFFVPTSPLVRIRRRLSPGGAHPSPQELGAPIHPRSAPAARETPREFVERESHYVWGQRYLLTVREEEAGPTVRRNHRAITLKVRPGSSSAERGAVLHEWHKSLLHEAICGVIRK